MDDGEGLHNDVTIFNASLKWLKWQVLCYVYLNCNLKKKIKQNLKGRASKLWGGGRNFAL